MVGHTGVWDATIAALAVIDALPRPGRRRRRAVDADDPAAPGALLAITADHGNADELRDADGQPGDGPLAQPGAARPRRPAVARPAARDGVLADVAPTLLELAGLPPWAGMTGRSLRSCDSIRRPRRPEEPAPRGPASGHRPDPRQHRAHPRDPAAGPRVGPVRHVRRRFARSIAAAVASSAGCGSSRSSCWSCSWSSRLAAFILAPATTPAAA